MDSIHYGTTVFCKKVATSIFVYSHRGYHLPQLQNISLCVYCQVQRWKGTVYNLLSQDCALRVMGCFSLSKPTYQQLCMTLEGSSDAVAIQIAAPWGAHATKHNIEWCPGACSNCKGSGSTNPYTMKVYVD